LLSLGLLPAKRNAAFALVTGQAGPGLLIVDGLKSAGVHVPELGAVSCAAIQAHLPPMTFIKNPIDTGRPGPGFPLVVVAAAQDPAIDAVLVYAISEPSVLDPARALTPAMASGKPIVFGTLGMRRDLDPALAALRELRIACVLSPERLVLAGVALAADARGRWNHTQRTEAPPVLQRVPLSGLCDEDGAKTLLAEYGIRSPQRILCHGRDAAFDAFARIGGAVVVKIAADDVPHKTEVGGVHLNICSAATLAAALDKIEKIPTSDPGKFLMEEMAPEGVELIVGGVRDPSWGVVLMVGIGGITAEAMADSAVALAPVSDVDVETMLASLRGAKLLDGFRTFPVCNRASIAQALKAIGQLMLEHPEIAELEINPLRVNADGALALDALIVNKSLQGNL
jgi:acyl-CoA synthetase (NDP forming)